MPVGKRSDLTLSGFVSSVLVVAALIGGSYWLSLQERNAQAWISHTEEVLGALSATRAHLVDMQNGVRGFVISGDERDLRPFEAARNALRSDAVRVSELTQDNPAQQEQARELAQRITPRVQAADAVVATRRASGFPAAKTLMAQIATQEQSRVRTILDSMEASERELLAQRLAEHKSRLEAFWASMAAVVLLLLAALSTLYVQVRRKRALEQKLLQREQQFHLMTDSITEYAVLMLDLQGRIQSWNPGAQRIKGYAAGEIIGRHFSCFYTPEDLREGKPDQVLAIARSAGVFSDEGWRVRKDGSRFWASVTLTPVRGGRDGEVTGFCKVTRDLSDRKAAQDQLEALVEERTRELRSANQELAAAKQRLEELSARLISAQEQERRHIARELHDETGQALTLIRLNLAELVDANAGAENRVQQCVEHVDRAIRHIRGLSVQLRPPMLDDLGLLDAIEWALEQQGEAAGWHTRLDAPHEIDRMPEHIETACFRICQESLTNAARYANATEVSVSLRVADGALAMEVADNGSGFDLQRYQSVDERKKHFGLVSMTERAALAGGRLEIDTAPGQGTRVRVRFPLH